jgi:hypothetical protein
VDLGLTAATAKFQNRADFSFEIYRCDPRWGLRSAAERYYRLFPQLFEKRMPEDGGWVCWGLVAAPAAGEGVAGVCGFCWGCVDGLVVLAGLGFFRVVHLGFL